jgi:hypothetical protein
LRRLLGMQPSLHKIYLSDTQSIFMKLRKIFMAIAITCTITACETVAKIASSISPSDIEMALGIKQALEQGLFKTFDAAQNPEVNPILAFAFPGDAQKITSTLNTLGLGSIVNGVTGKVNTAVASAFSTAKPIFVNSLKNMSIRDAASILITNNDHAATDYFKANTKTQLITAFKPIADSTIKTQGVDKDWSRIATAVNNLPFSSIKVENSLGDFIAARAVDGMYLIVAEEEKKIRTDLSARKSDLVKRVFGYADDQLKAKGLSYQ